MCRSHLQDPANGRKSKGKVLKYIVYEDQTVEHPTLKNAPRPRNNPCGPEDGQMDSALMTQIQTLLRQEFLMNERAKSLENRIQARSVATYIFFFKITLLAVPLEKGTEGVLHNTVIRMHDVGRGQKNHS